ncbi:MarR family transcriptional regulator [Gordonia sp. TBRC 11910]|uniref:MarR family transcriptional regulator n=1 Tax=Gordonia asplenii TaxID=2725283 RepID=A0A848L0Z3_9ACTN|nr:MarR family transcriptional regulator [Gordonia asplenii]NMO04127.1 MarR family transcriptional regulator [Gordonia asplenii]
MVDHTDNSVVYQESGGDLAFLLMGAFRSLVDDVHAQLSKDGFPDARPVHGFTLQALGGGATAVELAERLGVTKQAVAKTITRLEEGGYVARAVDAADSRRKLITPTERGRALLVASARAFDDALDAWRAQAGEVAITGMIATLRAVQRGESVPLDLGAWSG